MTVLSYRLHNVGAGISLIIWEAEASCLERINIRAECFSRFTKVVVRPGQSWSELGLRNWTLFCGCHTARALEMLSVVQSSSWWSEHCYSWSSLSRLTSSSTPVLLDRGVRTDSSVTTEVPSPPSGPTNSHSAPTREVSRTAGLPGRRDWGSAAGWSWIMRITFSLTRNKYRLIRVISLGIQRLKLQTFHRCLHPGKYPRLSQFLYIWYWIKKKLILKPSENWETLERKLNWKIFRRSFNRSNLQLLKRNLLTSGSVGSILSCYYRNWYLLF